MGRGDAPPAKQSCQFLFLYTLAWIGCSIAYVPFLTVLLPVRIDLLAGDGSVSWLAYLSFVGAIASSLANIGFGWLSDKLQNRRLVAGAGLFLSSCLLISMGTVEKLSTLIVLIACWQLALNMMLSPIAAWAGDCVPDCQKGRLGGLLSFAPAMGAMVGIVVTIPGLATDGQRLWIVTLFVAGCVLPAILLGKPRPFPHLMESANQEPAKLSLPLSFSGTAIRMWIARLLVQIIEVALFTYLFLWLRSLSSDVSDNDTAWVYSAALVIGIPLALFAGRWADQQNRPIPPLGVSAAIIAIGLLVMAFSGNVLVALGGYLLFGIAGAVFLALHSAQTLRVLPRPETRGRDLGLFNLTNTLPALIMPWLTLALVPTFGFSALFLLLALLAICASLILFSIAWNG